MCEEEAFPSIELAIGAQERPEAQDCESRNFSNSSCVSPFALEVLRHTNIANSARKLTYSTAMGSMARGTKRANPSTHGSVLGQIAKRRLLHS